MDGQTSTREFHFFELGSPSNSHSTRIQFVRLRLTEGYLTSQFSEKIPQVSYKQFGLFPTGEMSASRHSCVLDQIEIASDHALGRIQGWQLMGKRGERGRHVHFSGEVGNFVYPAPIKPHGGADGVRDQVNHYIRENLVFREDGLKIIWRIAPDFQFFGNPCGRAERVVRERE